MTKNCLALTGAIATLALCGCGGSNGSMSPPPPNTTSVLYIGTANTISAFTVNSNGGLTSLPAPLNQSAGPALAASQSFVFAGDTGLFSTNVLSLQPSFPGGTLSFRSTAGFPVIGGFTVNLMAACGNQLIAGVTSGALVVFSVGVSGQLAQAGQIVGFAGSPSNIAVDKACSHVYVSDAASANIFGFQNSNGSLTDLPGSPFSAGLADPGKGLFGLSFDPSGKFLFVANQTEGKLYGFSVGSDGSLTSVPGSPFPVGTSPVAVLTASVSSSNFLYVSDTVDNTIASYRIDGTTGTLSHASSASTGKAPTYLNSSGSLLFSANVQDSNLSAFQLHSDGTMTPVSGSPFALASQPVGAGVVVAGTQ